MLVLTERGLYQSKQRFSRPAANLKAPSPSLTHTPSRWICQGRLLRQFCKCLHNAECVCVFQGLMHLFLSFFFVMSQGDRGFEGLPGLPGNKGHIVSLVWYFDIVAVFI